MAVNACEAQSAARSALTVNPISPCTASFTLRHLNHCHLSNFRLLDSPPAETPHHFTKSPQHSLCAAGKTSIHANGARAIKPPNSSLPFDSVTADHCHLDKSTLISSSSTSPLLTLFLRLQCISVMIVLVLSFLAVFGQLPLVLQLQSLVFS